MRTTLLIAFTIFSFSATAQTNINDFTWLAGKWKYAGREKYEVWKLSADGNTLAGETYRIKDGDTTILEKLTLEKRVDGFYYIADVPHNNKPVPFRVTKADANGFACENPAHDFPTHIKYTRVEKGKIEAVISGGGKDIKYIMEYSQ